MNNDEHQIKVGPGYVIDTKYPLTVKLLPVPSIETQEEYFKRCQDIADFVVQRSAHLNQPSAINFDDPTKFKKVSEHAYEAILPTDLPE